MLKTRPLLAKDPLTKLVKKKGINTFEGLLLFIKQLPYGRNSNRTNLNLVIIEEKGTCSSKHAFIKKIANLNNIANVTLILGMYKMNEKNTPGIGKTLFINTIDFIPEAHCYLKINNTRVDITTENANFKKLEKEILKEIEITPEQVIDFKVTYHQEFLKKWILENNMKFGFEEVWAIREQCIANLSNDAIS